MQARVLARSVEEYLAFEADADTRHTFWDGYIVDMAGADPVHNRLAMNVGAGLHQRLRPRNCNVFGSDQRLKLGHSRYVYPDLVVTCETPQYAGPRPMSLLNPHLIVEVTSESTAEQDYTDKLAAYQQIESLREYWIVEPTKPLVVRYYRHGEAWLIQIVRGLDNTVQSHHLDLALPMDEVYALVTFAPEVPLGKPEEEGA
jgi:Uma2 family endonuclease